MIYKVLKKEKKKGEKTGKSKLQTWFKFLVSALFVTILVKTISFQEVVKLFSSLNVYYLVLLLLLSYVMILESCLKWQILLKAKGIRVPLPSLVRLYILGYFFNNFLPSMVGGDSARGLLLGRRLKRVTDVFLSIFMERFTGFLALILFTATAVIVNHPLVRVGNLRSIVIVLLAGALILVVLVFSRKSFGILMGLVPEKFEKLRDKLDTLHVSLLEFSHHKGDFACVLFLSLLFHFLTGVNLYYACLALNYEVGFLEMIVVTPFIVLLSLVPITINGIGLWEGSFVLFFSLLGIPSSLALSAALLLRLKTLLVSALGGLFYLQESRNDESKKQ